MDKFAAQSIIIYPMKYLKMLVLSNMLLLTGLFFTGIQAQNLELTQSIPLDPSVRTGKLSNGLTYFIRKNAKPEKRVDLYLAVNAGSVLEEDNQVGLAHFAEHMAFNGSKNFPKNELVSYLQSQGVKFGADLNAYTSFNETVYILPIPSDKEETIDKGFQILEDWAHNVSYDDKEIDKERGVVIEEWRLGRGADQRMRDQWLPILLKDSRYATRLPIGTKENLETFKYETIKRFYQDWYRPDLMAVIVVGDIDVDKMEEKIKTYFNRLEPVKNPKERVDYSIPNQDKAQVVIVKDKEASSATVLLAYNYDNKPAQTIDDLRKGMVTSLYTSMLNARLDELRQKAEPPFVFAGSFAGSFFARAKNTFLTQASVNEKNIELGLKTILEEQRRVKKFGFTAPELERAKKQLFLIYEKGFKESDKTESDAYVQEYLGYFLRKEPAPGIAFEYEVAKKFLPTITLEEVNANSKELVENKQPVVVIMAPDKEGVVLPTEDKVRKLLFEVNTATLTPYEEKILATSLLKEAPKAGKVVAEKKIEKVDVTEITLSNGVKVSLKKTDFKNDEILISAYSFGGSSLYPDADYYSASYAGTIVAETGAGEFNKVDLQKFLAGKSVRLNPYIRDYQEGMNGSTSPQDLELFLQLMHLYFTKPYKDAEGYNSFISKSKSQLQSAVSNPQFYYQEQLVKMLTDNHMRSGFPSLEVFDKINMDRAFEIYKERFADASGFKFFVVGNFELEKIKPLLELYLGSLPSTQKTETWKDTGLRAPKGAVDKEVFKGSDPKSQVTIIFNGDVEYSQRNRFLMRSVAEWLNIKLIEILREEKGGVYGVGARASLQRLPVQTYSVFIQFPCAPENVADLSKTVFEQAEKLAKEGCTAEDLQKIKETYKREFEISLKENGFWRSSLETYDLNGEKFESILNFPVFAEELTADMIKEAAAKYLKKENYMRLVLLPEKK